MPFSTSEEINDILVRIGYKEKTEIQKRVLPLTETRDIMGLSETGTGKTACFVIPLIEELVADPYGVHSLILTPTRELCLQTKEQIDIVGTYAGIKCEIVHGGVEVHKQVAAVHKKPHIVVSTPGRLASMLCTEKTVGCFKRVKKIILDEADLLLNGDQALPVHHILTTLLALSPDIQLLLFSATDIAPRVPVKVDAEHKENREDLLQHTTLSQIVSQMPCPALWSLIFQRPRVVVDTRVAKVPKAITQEYALVHMQAKEGHLFELLQCEHKHHKVIVFMNRSEECTILATVLQELGINAEALSRHTESRARYSTFYRFKSGLVKVLLTTDVISRGIDIKDVACVINYDLPNDVIDYIHRIGRTGRLLAKGYALSFVTSTDLSLLEHIKTSTGTPIEEKKLKPFTSPKLLNKIATHRQFIIQRLERTNRKQ